MTEPRAVAAQYFSGWRSRDFDAVRAILADDATFQGPLGSADGAEDCVAGLRGMSKMMSGIDIHAMVAEGDDVITWYDLYTDHAPPAPTANWMHLSDGKIARIRATFDPRAIIGG